MELLDDCFEKEDYDTLAQKKIITENDKDDFLMLKTILSNYRSGNNHVNITIAPTMDCNYSCHYCFEKCKKSYMDSGTCNAIAKYINKYLKSKSLHITWFGGEPLLALNEIQELYYQIDRESLRSYSSNIITNGFLLDKNAVRILEKICVNRIQITMDGTKENHNKIKFTKDCKDTFSKTIRNIDDFASLNSSINLIIRVNITRDNADDYIALYKFVTQRYTASKNIEILPAFVKDIGGCSDDSCAFKGLESVQYLKKIWNEHRLLPFNYSYPSNNFSECAVRNKNTLAIGPEGEVYKCWEIMGNKDYIVGHILHEEFIITNSKIMSRYLHGADPLDSPVCSKCAYLPICIGGCPHSRIENEFNNKKNDLCTIWRKDLAHFLKMDLIRKGHI